MQPPPYGGISVHVQRVIIQLEKQDNKVVFVDCLKGYKSKFIFFYFDLFLKILKFRPNVLIYNTISLHKWPIEFSLLVFLKLFFKFEFINVNHVNRFLGSLNKTQKKLFKFLFKFVNKQIFVGKPNFDSFENAGININCNYSIESSFLPIFNNEQILPQDLLEFIKNKTVIVANASKYELFNGADLYGLDLIVKSVNQLKNKYPNLVVVFAVSSYDLGIKDLQKIINDNQTFYFLKNYKHPIWPLIKKADIFIRPTRTDGGFSISLEEALHFGVRSIASDVCERPCATILFKDGSVKDLTTKIEFILNEQKVNKCNYSNMQSAR